MKYIATIVLGIVILGLTHSRIADIVGMLVIAFGVYKLYVSEHGKGLCPEDVAGKTRRASKKPKQTKTSGHGALPTRLLQKEENDE